MRDKWYGDKRDLVKWSVLLELAHRYHLKHILQILYFRPDEWAGVQIDGTEVEVNPAVIEFFRKATSISRMECGPRIEIVDDVFCDRKKYHAGVLERIRRRPIVPGIVFLDPDTGLEPSGKPDLKHVLVSELSEVWQSMNPSDLMVFYQHQTNYNGKEWIGPKKLQFENALGIRPGGAKLAHAFNIAGDVAFFFVEKEPPQHSEGSVSKV